MGNNLPKGWIITNLEKCCDILDNKRIPINSFERAKRIGNVPYYGATGQVGYIDKYLFDEELVLLGEDGAPFFDKQKNVAYIIKGKSWVNNHAHVLKAKTIVTSNSYLYYFLNNFDYTEFVNGTTRLKLTQTKLKEIPLKLAPTPEQSRIVEKLNMIKVLQDSSKTRLEKIPLILKHFRQSVLEVAVSGKLTKEWREKNKEFEERIEAKLEDVIITFQNGISKRKSEIGNKTIVLRLADVKNYTINIETNRKIGLSKEEIKKYGLVENDLLVIRVNGSTDIVGRFVLVNKYDETITFCDHFIRIKTNEKLIMPQFLKIISDTNEIRNFITQNMVSSAGQNTVSQTTLSNIPILLPSIFEQKEIVRRVDELFKIAYKLEERYKKAKTYTDKLEQSVLAKAFRGELVPQDPNDEPASVLLERIKKEKEKLNAK